MILDFFLRSLWFAPPGFSLSRFRKPHAYEEADLLADPDPGELCVRIKGLKTLTAGFVDKEQDDVDDDDDDDAATTRG